MQQVLRKYEKSIICTRVLSIMLPCKQPQNIQYLERGSLYNDFVGL